MRLVTYRVRQDCTDKRGRLRLAGQSVELPASEPVPAHFEKMAERVQPASERAAHKAAEEAERARLLARLRELGAKPPRGHASLALLRETLALEEISIAGGG